MAAMAGLFGLLLVTLGVTWAASRLRTHETPRWDEAAFPALHEAPGAPPAWSERWVVAVHPGCPHCRVSLASLAAARDRSAATVRVTALLVDAETVPSDSVLAALPADETRWDEGRLWRLRWAHSIYGEVFCFDPDGRLLRLIPPMADEHDALRQLRAAGVDAQFD